MQEKVKKEVKGKREKNIKKEGKPGGHISFRVREYRIVIAAGVLTILFTLFILIMGLKYPSADGNRIIFYSALLILLIIGIGCCVRGIFHSLTVEDMNIYYVNCMGRKTSFTLDDIGYCKLKLASNQQKIILYDLLGNRLCKLESDMKGSEDFFRYLLDNRVRVECKAEQAGYSNMPVLEAYMRETAVCEEEIPKCADTLYGRVRDILLEWEKQNKTFGAYWEFGYGEFSAADLEKGKDCLWSRTSSIHDLTAGLPEDYACILEAYLKKDNEYVIDQKNKAVCILFPYLIRTCSYQIGERLRLRKMNEDVLTEWIREELELLTQILPKRKYHTEPIVLQHELRKTAGIRREPGV